MQPQKVSEMADKRRCSCGWTGESDEFYDAPHPFLESDTVVACPNCLSVIGECDMVVCCDEPDCWREVTCGTPTPDGYRNTCTRHRPKDASSTR